MVQSLGRSVGRVEAWVISSAMMSEWHLTFRNASREDVGSSLSNGQPDTHCVSQSITFPGKPPKVHRKGQMWLPCISLAIFRYLIIFFNTVWLFMNKQWATSDWKRQVCLLNIWLAGSPVTFVKSALIIWPPITWASWEDHTHVMTNALRLPLVHPYKHAHTGPVSCLRVTRCAQLGIKLEIWLGGQSTQTGAPGLDFAGQCTYNFMNTTSSPPTCANLSGVFMLGPPWL